MGTDESERDAWADVQVTPSSPFRHTLATL